MDGNIGLRCTGIEGRPTSLGYTDALSGKSEIVRLYAKRTPVPVLDSRTEGIPISRGNLLLKLIAS